MFRGLLTAFFVALALTLSALAPVYAADPTGVPTALPTPAATVAPAPVATAGASPVILDPLDPRAGEGASRGGAPLLAMLFVVGLGTTVAAVTFVIVRISRRA